MSSLIKINAGGVNYYMHKEEYERLREFHDSFLFGKDKSKNTKIKQNGHSKSNSTDSGKQDAD